MMDEHKNRSRQTDTRGSRHGSKGSDDRQNARRERLDDALEQGLEDTFPGSDPVSVTQPPGSPYDKNEAKRP
ncbi:MAG TPA: hypothetical protein VL048_00985 [Xanthobacteraceae bacterium]|nr:hypothetical protein [Xanthobacteraceae bacterium]